MRAGPKAELRNASTTGASVSAGMPPRSTVAVYRARRYACASFRRRVSAFPHGMIHDPLGRIAPNGVEPPVPGARIRPLASMEDCRACVELQREVWGYGSTDVVPATLLHVVGHVGGLAAGAFSSSGEMIGFVFGISGVTDGVPSHWSHMLAVREPSRNVGVGRMLKEYQRDALAALGIRRVYWSFDPLMAKNAHLNLNRLGARVVDYVEDMYGTTASPLHYGVATDRLVVCLTTDAPAVHVEAANGVHALPVRSAFPRASDASVSDDRTFPPELLLEIPLDLPQVLVDRPAEANAWRMGVREQFQWAMQNGYAVRRLERDATASRAFYLLVRESSTRSPSSTRSNA
jgi:chorismate synthase